MKKGEILYIVGIALIIIGLIWCAIGAVRMWDVAMSLHLKWQTYWKPIAMIVLGQIFTMFR